MDLWIRSQDKEVLTKVNNLCYMRREDVLHYLSADDLTDDMEHFVWSPDGAILGTYKSKERALEILDKIQECMETNTLFDLYSRTGVYPNDFNKKWNYVKVFQMPEE